MSASELVGYDAETRLRRSTDGENEPPGVEFGRHLLDFDVDLALFEMAKLRTMSLDLMVGLYLPGTMYHS